MLSVLTLARKSLGQISVLLVLLLGIAACTTDTAPIVTPRPDGPVKVGLLVPSGTGQARDELLARSLENSARLAIADLAAVQSNTVIELMVYQTWGQPQKAAEVALQAVSEGVEIILGPVFSQETEAVGLALNGTNVNVLSFSNNTEVANPNVFVLGQTFNNTANRLSAFAVSRGLRLAMVVNDKTTAGELGRVAIEAGIVKAGGKLVGSLDYEFSQNGIIAAAPIITQTAQQNNVQALFLTADTAGALPLLTKLLSDSGLGGENTRFIGLTRWDIPASTPLLASIQGGWFTLPDPILYQQYQARYEAAYNEPPHPISGLAYDGIAAIGALVSSGTNSLSTAALTQTSGFVGVNGIFRLLKDGTNERGLAIAEIQNKVVNVIDPAPRIFARASF
ncbi:MAG: penicillin-binding protein activator [Paracoccaceae bacterium]|jgi:ABC-type branched-subunit amino acid transport system substrate-binding protein